MTDNMMLTVTGSCCAGVYLFLSVLYIRRIVAAVLIGRWRTLAIPPQAPFSLSDYIRIIRGILCWPIYVGRSHLVEMVKNYRDHWT